MITPQPHINMKINFYKVGYYQVAPALVRYIINNIGKFECQACNSKQMIIPGDSCFSPKKLIKILESEDEACFYCNVKSPHSFAYKEINEKKEIICIHCWKKHYE